MLHGMAVIFADQPCIDPATLAAECDRMGIPYGEWRSKANRFYCPRDVDYGEGDLLLTRRHLDNIDRTKSHELEFKDSLSGTSVKLAKIHITAAVCVTPGRPKDPNAIYHVKVADVRQLWPMFVLDRGYNSSQTPGDDSYSEDSTGGAGTAMGWAEVWGDIASSIPANGEGALREDLPELSVEYDGVPTDLNYWGMSVTDAMRDFTQRLGVVLAYDPIKNTGKLVTPGETQDGLANALDDLLGKRLHDAEPIYENVPRIPASVRVLFPKRPEAGWGRDPWYSIDVANDQPPAGVLLNSKVILYDDLQAIMSANTCTNAAALNTRAEERAAAYFTQVRTGHGYRQLVYSGAHGAILPGSEITAVVWEDRGEGIKTEIVQRPFYRTSMATWKSNANDERWRLVDHVWVFDTVSGVTPPTGYKPCQAEHYDTENDVWYSLFNCWYREMNGQTAVVGRHLARFAGQKENDDGDRRPVYIGGCCPDGSGDGPGEPPEDDEDHSPQPTADCPRRCGSVYLPNTVTAVVAGVTNGSCMGCTSVNGTYTLSHLGSDYRGCAWQSPSYDAGCGSALSPHILLFYDTENIISPTPAWHLYIALGAANFLATLSGTFKQNGSNVFTVTGVDYCLGDVTITITWSC